MVFGYTYNVNSAVPMFNETIKNFDPDGNGSYRTAIDNTVQDMNTDCNPYGNITSVAQNSLNRCCNPPHGGKCIDIEMLVRDHQSHQRASGAIPRKKPEENLRRVVAFHTFVDFHHKSGRDALANLVRAKSVKTEALSVQAMRGSTGRDGCLSWWTFGLPRPDNGRKYAEELALTIEEANPADAVADAAKINGVVEVQIPSSSFPKNLFKPSALDGFCRNTKFKPDHTSSEHGWTKPDSNAKVGLERRPELVSQSFSYTDVDPDIDLDITYLPY
jgi:hypothetical protein